MQKTLKIAAGNDARRNADKEFEHRANQAQKRECERTMKTAIAADGIEFSMFDDAKPMDATGQVSIF